MPFDESKAMLQESDYARAEKCFNEYSEEFLVPDKIPANVIGMGIGVRYKHGEPTGEPAMVALVEQKLGKEFLSKEDLVPSKFGDIPTDVVEVGPVYAGAARRSMERSVVSNNGGNYQMTPTYYEEEFQGRVQAPDFFPSQSQEFTPETLRNRVRPAKGGYSVGHYQITAGTLGTCAYDIQPGGVGVPNKYYILSNNHVLANSNNARLGDPILQPGPFDGGTVARDTIARLTRFVPIQFAPAVPLPNQNNLVDAAIAEGQFHDLDREIYWIGKMRGWKPISTIRPGLLLQKTGRTTNYTTGRVTAVRATIDVNFGSGRVARFKDQIVTTNMSAGGDSGSLVSTLDNVAVGLLFAGSSSATILNYIQHVRNLLRVEVAEQMIL
ncbi:MAG: hypothetical protein SFZ03_04430 [Candidatus Melainabacteria bacterium]|nr:hypothetical protein [Candidatus Melainabacteria bacterium]